MHNKAEYGRNYWRKNRERLLAYHRAYREKNKEKRIASVIAWIAANPEKHKQYKKTTYLRHRDKRLAEGAKWQRGNRDKVAAIQARYREKWKNDPAKKGRKNELKTLWKKANLEKHLFALARRRARARGIEFTIELQDVVIPHKCPLLGIVLDSFSSDHRQWPSIDRVDPTRGYIKGNIAVISLRANRLKNNATLEELQCLVSNLKKIAKKNADVAPITRTKGAQWHSAEATTTA